MLHSFLFFCLVQLCVVVLSQQSQPLTFVNPSATSLIQCATIPIKWNGGASPFSLIISTVDTPNSTFEQAEDTLTIDSSPSNWTVDLPAGTSFTIIVEDNNGVSVQSGNLTVLPSTNTSCLDDSSDDPPPDASPTSPHRDPTKSQTLQTNSQSSSPISSNSVSKGQSGSGTPRNYSGSVGAGVVIIVTAAISLTIYFKRRRSRTHLTGRENVVRAFGNDTAGFDGDEDPALVADPFVYQPAAKSEVSLNESETRQGTNSFSIRSAQVFTNRASKKGERDLPTIHVTPPKDNPSSHLQDDDIERLAARMVAMMSSGRMSEQAWSPNHRTANDDDDDLPAPPMYKDVTRTN